MVVDGGSGPAQPVEADPGELASDPAYRVTPERTVTLMSSALAQLHSIDPPPGVAVASVEALVAAAERCVGEGSVDASTLSEPYRHLSPQRLLSILRDGAHAASASAAVVATHGRPTFDRLACADGDVVGLLDWSRVAWSDPHRDLAVAARDVAAVFRPILVPVLIEQYRLLRAGWDGPDPVLLDWYALAAELGA